MKPESNHIYQYPTAKLEFEASYAYQEEEEYGRAGSIHICRCFRLRLHMNARKSAITKDEDIAVGAVGPSEGSDLNLSCSCNEPLFDLYRPPLVDFHQYERTELGTSNQDNLNTVDFILISMQPRSEGNPEQHNALNFYSHHSCHCREKSEGNPEMHVVSTDVEGDSRLLLCRKGLIYHLLLSLLVKHLGCKGWHCYEWILCQTGVLIRQ